MRGCAFGVGLLLSSCVGWVDDALPSSALVSPQERQTPAPTAVEAPDAGASSEPQPCEPFAGATYATLAIDSPRTLAPEEDPELNLALRGWEKRHATLGLVDVDGPTDPGAPKLRSLLSTPSWFTRAAAVREWDPACACATQPLELPEVSVVGLAAWKDTVVSVPLSGYQIDRGLQALVLYATEDTVVLKYTREDDVIGGYTLYVQNVCVDPRLVALYRQSDAEGRRALPALAGGQPFARGRGGDVQVVIRDTGSFMDPRVRKDWW